MVGQHRGGAPLAALPFLLLSLMTAVAPAQSGDPSSFHHTCVPGEVTWHEARELCAVDGRQLATFCNKNQFEAAFSKVNKGCVMGCELPLLSSSLPPIPPLFYTRPHAPRLQHATAHGVAWRVAHTDTYRLAKD